MNDVTKTQVVISARVRIGNAIIRLLAKHDEQDGKLHAKGVKIAVEAREWGQVRAAARA